MEMRYEIEFASEQSLVRVRTAGIASGQGFVGLLSAVLESSEWKAGMNILVDNRELDFTELTIEEVAAFREATVKRFPAIGPSRVASVLPSMLGTGISRMWDQPLLVNSPFVHQAFNSPEEAMAWLQQTV